MNLKSVALPPSVVEIGREAFSQTGITQITLPASAVDVQKDVFANCGQLVSAAFAEGTKAIGAGLFKNCKKLKTVSIPDTVASIGMGAFEGCTRLTDITLPQALTAVGSSVFMNCTGLTSIVLPASVTAVGDYAFVGCTHLASVTLPETLTALGSHAFQGCTALSSVNEPSALAELGDRVFEDTPLAALSWALPESYENADLFMFSRDKLPRTENARILPYNCPALYGKMPPALRTFDAREADLALVTDVRHRERHDYLGGKAYDTITDVYLCAPDGTARLLASITNAPPPTGASPLYGANASAEQIWSAIERFF